LVSSNLEADFYLSTIDIQKFDMVLSGVIHKYCNLNLYSACMNLFLSIFEDQPQGLDSHRSMLCKADIFVNSYDFLVHKFTALKKRKKFQASCALNQSRLTRTQKAYQTP
jgi:hypothetical protein